MDNSWNEIVIKLNVIDSKQDELSKDVATAQNTANEKAEKSRASIESVWNGLFHPDDDKHGSRRQSKSKQPSMNSVNDRLREDEAESKGDRDSRSNIVINAVGMAHGIDSDNSENEEPDNDNDNDNVNDEMEECDMEPNVDGMTAMIRNKIRKDRRLTQELIDLLAQQLDELNGKVSTKDQIDEFLLQITATQANHAQKQEMQDGVNDGFLNCDF